MQASGVEGAQLGTHEVARDLRRYGEQGVVRNHGDAPDPADGRQRPPWRSELVKARPWQQYELGKQLIAWMSA
jgi:hypothetical protein